jgi:N-acetyl-anhydromuramyl-L-alanine amidase AmpD
LSIHWVQSPNYTSRRLTPVAVVIHVIDDELDGNISGTDHWFSQAASAVSAHFAISSAGEIHQYVLEDNSAFHAGRVYLPTWKGIQTDKAGRYVNPNLYTFGIEHEGNEFSEWPEPMVAASAKLAAALCGRHNITPNRNTIVLHREINAKKSCPGAGFDIEDYLNRINVAMNG